MKFLSIISFCAVVLLLPMQSFAHERQVFNIGGTDFLFVVGSTNEPVMVDDKTTASIRIINPDPKDIGNSSAVGAKPVVGLESNLKLEVSADGSKKEFKLTPAYKDPGHYNAVFFPTKATIYSYRVFGTINNTQFDKTFTCMPGEHVMSGTPVTSEVNVSPGVTQKFQMGMFGCPQPKKDLGIPVMAPSAFEAEGEMHEHMEGIEAEIAKVKESAEQGSAGVAFGALGTLLAIVALYRSRKS